MKNQSGFTAVELLITLFVAAAFLMSGYQLYNMIILDGGDALSRANASNVAYNYLQTYKVNQTYIASPCVKDLNVLGGADNSFVTKTVTGLANVSINVSVTCPYSASPYNITSLSKVTVIVKYGNSTPQQEVTEATYVTK